MGAEACAKPALDASGCAGGRSQAFASAQRRAPFWRPAWHAPRPLARQSKKRNKQFHHLRSSPYSSLLHSLSHRRRDPPSPKGSVITTSAISVRQARLCVVSGAFSVWLFSLSYNRPPAATSRLTQAQFPLFYHLFWGMCVTDLPPPFTYFSNFAGIKGGLAIAVVCWWPSSSTTCGCCLLKFGG